MEKKQSVKRTSLRSSSVATTTAIPVGIAKANSGTLPTDTNQTNGVLSFVYEANREAVGTDRLGALDLDGFHSKNVAEIGEFKNGV